MRFMNPRSALLTMRGLIGTASTFISVLSVAGRWECSGTGLEAETVNFRLELKQSGTDVSGILIVGDDEIPIREGKVQGNEIELITFADDKQFTSVATVEGDEFRGTWKDDTGRSGKWQGKRLPAGSK
jgi:hypothetical protein